MRRIAPAALNRLPCPAEHARDCRAESGAG